MQPVSDALQPVADAACDAAGREGDDIIIIIIICMHASWKRGRRAGWGGERERERQSVVQLPASAHVLTTPPSPPLLSLLHSPAAVGEAPPPPSPFPARPHLGQSERSVGAGHSESTIPARSSCISPELTGELAAQREETRSNPASVCVCGLKRVCVCVCGCKCVPLADSAAAALLFHRTFVNGRSASGRLLPPLRDQEGSARGGDRRERTSFTRRPARSLLTAPGGRAGRMIAAQLLAYYFTELKDDQLKKVRESSHGGPLAPDRRVV